MPTSFHYLYLHEIYDYLNIMKNISINVNIKYTKEYKNKYKEI